MKGIPLNTPQVFIKVCDHNNKRLTNNEQLELNIHCFTSKMKYLIENLFRISFEVIENGGHGALIN